MRSRVELGACFFSPLGEKVPPTPVSDSLPADLSAEVLTKAGGQVG
jgi:hypothetical protein